MNGVQDISWSSLAIGYLLVGIPLAIFWYYRTGLVRSTVIAVIRMALQLYLVGLYLEYIFTLNNPWINLVWVLVMIIIASFTAIRRSRLNRKLFLLPVMLAMILAVFAVDMYFLGVVIQLDYLFDARYFIPITGMLIGNSMSGNIIAFNTYFSSLERDQIQYRFALANGATVNEALRKFIAEALRRSLSPTIATTSVVGLISLPGMMTGQILGGSSPSVAIKYQIMIMITILVSSVLTVVLSILISNKFIFDEMGMPKQKLLVTPKIKHMVK